jgi:hypothetical protein
MRKFKIEVFHGGPFEMEEKLNNPPEDYTLHSWNFNLPDRIESNGGLLSQIWILWVAIEQPVPRGKGKMCRPGQWPSISFAFGTRTKVESAYIEFRSGYELCDFVRYE